MDDDRPEGPRSAFDSPTFGQDGSFRVDKPVGSATISPCGRDIALASRQGLHIIDLDSPWSPPRHLAYHTPWEVADVQWSPFAARDYWVVSTSNQKALVWNLNMQNREAAVEHVLHAHTRAISDINFSAHYPDILATCAVDSFVHCWDLRHPARPALTFCDWFAGATQVKWNRTNPHILASSHDKFLRIWDDRKGASPLRSIEAHATKIYGIDWNRFKTMNLATCSLDKTIKFWDYTQEENEPERVLQTPFPVWRARHTPFGYGLLAMPQRGDNDLHLYDRRINEDLAHSVIAKAVNTFEGHHDQVKEFLWRPRGNVSATMDDRDYQLVSWGSDRVLRLHEVKDDVLRSVGYQKGMEVKRTTGFTRKGAAYKSFRDTPQTDDAAILPTAHSSPNRHNGSAMRLPSSVDMNKLSALIAGGKGYGDHTSSAPTTTLYASHDMDPISWMRGVKIGKRNISSPGLHQSLSTAMSPTLKSQPIWDVYESLGEEITMVGDKFSKIKFDDVDVQRGRILVSLSGPWGLGETSTYLKVRIDFPIGYPSTSVPMLSIEKTSSIHDEAFKRILSDVDSLTSAFMSHRRSSLETILRYLLGEQSLEEGLQNLQVNRDGDDVALTQKDELSSSDDDDDDEGLGRYADLQSDSVEAIDPMIVINNAQYNVPLPKACGALWADNGTLVCFFPAKQEKEPSILDQSLRSSARNRNAISEGFGRLHDFLGRRKATTSTLGTREDGESEFDDFETSSSETSSSQGSGILQHQFAPVLAWEGNGFDKFHKHIPDGSQKSVGDIGTVNSTAPKACMSVSLYDFSDLLPAKQILAKEYEIGNDFQHAARNASVARNYGYSEIADVWSLIGLILQEKVPLQIMRHPLVEGSIISIARRASFSSRNQDSGIDLSFETGDEEAPPLLDRVNWGSHPFGQRWLVKELFRYFEKQANVQMLAMMSCIFSRSTDRTAKTAKRSPRAAFSSEQRSHSSAYYPSIEVAISLSGASLHSSPPKALSSNSTTSSAGASVSDQVAISYESNTPPGFTSSGTDIFRRDSQTTSLSASPEHHRHVHRSNSNLSAMAASFVRPFSLSNSATSSPPNSLPKKRVSPSGSYLAATPSSITWAPGSMFGKTSAIQEGPGTNVSLSVSDTEDELPSATTTTNLTPISGFTTTLKNQDHFHDDGHATFALLDAKDEWRVANYQEAYSDLLYVWGLPNARCEILKYYGITRPITDPPRFDKSIRSIEGLATKNTSLSFGVHCTTCAFLTDNFSVVRCPSCSRALRRLLCLFCNTYVHNLASPCLNCGHTLHDSCRRSVVESGLRECISGCGCICSDHPSVEMPQPEMRRRADAYARDVSPAITVIADSNANEHDTAGRKGSEWEEMAYESLSRNLRGERRGSGRVVRERASQIWRGRLDRDQ